MISKETIKDMAEIAKLSFSEDELDKLAQQLSQNLSRFEKIKEVNIDNIEPTYVVNDYSNPLREDEVWESLPQEEVVKNTVEEQYGYFKILKVVD